MQKPLLITALVVFFAWLAGIAVLVTEFFRVGGGLPRAGEVAVALLGTLVYVSVFVAVLYGISLILRRLREWLFPEAIPASGEAVLTPTQRAMMDETLEGRKADPLAGLGALNRSIPKC